MLNVQISIWKNNFTRCHSYVFSFEDHLWRQSPKVLGFLWTWALFTPCCHMEKICICSSDRAFPIYGLLSCKPASMKLNFSRSSHLCMQPQRWLHSKMYHTCLGRCGWRRDPNGNQLNKNRQYVSHTNEQLTGRISSFFEST